MTITLRARQILPVAAVALFVLGAYLLGSARSAGATAPAPGSELRRPAAANLSAVVSPAATGSNGVVNGITVTGSGTVAGTPDTLVVSLSVTADGSTVSSAFSSANAAMSAVQRALRGQGLQAKDLSTSDVSVQSRYTNTGATDGYTVTEGLNATMHDIARAGRQISVAVAAGGNFVRVDGVSLDLTDTGSLVTRARDQAFADAKAKAQQYARDAGRGLGPVIAVAEQVQQPQPVYPYAGLAAAAPSALRVLPVAPGSANVVVAVTVTFGLG